MISYCANCQKPTVGELRGDSVHCSVCGCFINPLEDEKRPFTKMVGAVNKAFSGVAPELSEEEQLANDIAEMRHQVADWMKKDARNEFIGYFHLGGAMSMLDRAERLLRRQGKDNERGQEK